MPPREDNTLVVDLDNLDPDHETLNPPHDSPLRRTSLNNATFNLVATIVGGGVLSLPQAFAKAGIVLCTALLLFSAVITEFSLYLLCSCARRSGGCAKSYMEIVKYAFGDVAELCMTFVLWIFLCGVLIAFYVLILGIFSPLLKAFLGSNQHNHHLGSILNMVMDVDVDGPYFDRGLLCGVLILMMPFILKRNLYALRHICYVGFCSVCVIIISMSIRAVQRNLFVYDLLDYSNSTHRPEIKYYSTDPNDVLFAFPICVLSFLCSQNMVEVHSSLVNPSRKRVKKVLRTSIVSTFFLFLSFAFAGYFYSYSDCKDNIFLNFGEYYTTYLCDCRIYILMRSTLIFAYILDPSDPLIIVGRISMGVTLMFGVPVVLVPCRDAFLSIFDQLNHLKVSKSKHHVAIDERTFLSSKNIYTYSSLMNVNDTEKNVSHSDEKQQHSQHSMFSHIISTFFIITSTFLIAVAVPGVAIIWDILGSSMALIIGFILPCACYLKIRRKKGWRLLNIGAAALLIFSFVGCLLCTQQTLSKIRIKN